MSALQIILIVVIFVVVAGVGLAFVSNQEAERKKRMMAVVRGAAPSKSGNPESVKDLQDKRRAEIAKKLKESKDEQDSEDKKSKASLQQRILQAGWSISLQQFWMFSAGSMVFCLLLAKLAGFSLFVTLMVGVIGLLGLPRFVLKRAAARRQKKFLEDFPDALEAVVRLLKAGMPVSEAVSMISREFAGPVGEEMSIIYDKQKIGVPLHQAANESCRRMPLTEMQMFATGLAIQAQTGSSLSEVLSNLANVIRSRFRLKRKVKALSSEAVASACIIGALPNLVALGLYFVNPGYIETLFTTPVGHVLLAVAIVWMLLGMLVMKAMINFKV